MKNYKENLFLLDSNYSQITIYCRGENVESSKETIMKQVNATSTKCMRKPVSGEPYTDHCL
jgi:hypothetical protein